MIFLHLADLHLGKKLNDYPLYEDQKIVFAQAIDLCKKENVDAIVVAGDVYDSSAPSAEAMEAYDEFLARFYALGKPLLIISGNHDSAERLHVASSILRQNDVHIVTRLEDALTPVEISGVRFYLLPYFRPSEVNRVFGTDFHSYNEAMAFLIGKMNIDPNKPNVLVTHQSILPLGEKVLPSGSETSIDLDTDGVVGGSEVIDVKLFDCFDYMALGHIHKAQFVSHNARYAGALLKYHVKEASAKRSFSIVDVQGKTVRVEETPIALPHDLVILSGTLDEILSSPGHENDYVFARLEDEAYVDNPAAKLKSRFPLYLGMDLPRRAQATEEVEVENVEEANPVDLFGKFYEKYGGRELDADEKEIVEDLFTVIKEGA